MSKQPETFTEANRQLNEAGRDLFNIIAEELHLYVILGWLAARMPKYRRDA